MLYQSHNLFSVFAKVIYPLSYFYSMDKNAVKIGRVFGIKILLHYTWFIIFVLLAWSLASGYFPSALPGKTTLVYWLMGGFAALLLFASVLLHELSHSFMALKNKIKVNSITLFFLAALRRLMKKGLLQRRNLLSQSQSRL